MYCIDNENPRFLQRAKTVTARMPLYVDGSLTLAVPASGTYTLYDGNNTAIDTGAVTIPTSGDYAGIASYEILDTVIPATILLASNWYEKWVLTMSDGSIETVERAVYFCLRTLYCPISQGSLGRRISSLSALLPSSKSSFADYIKEAWADIESRLLQSGKRPYLITNSSALRPLVTELVRYYIFQDAKTLVADGSTYGELAEEAKAAYEHLWDTLTLEYDTSELGGRGSTEAVAGPPVIYTNRPPGLWFLGGPR